MPARCLSIHATYGCRHAGECCSDVWAVPVEPRVVQLVTTQNIRPAADAAPFVVARGVHRGQGAVVANQQDGCCVFFARDDSRLCAIHHHGGEAALPSACRHFPRVHLRDARGLLIAVSHFCPTAAALLLDDAPIEIVDAEPPLALAGDAEGMDATDALPPLLRPDLLMDVSSYGEWERRAIATLARPDLTHEAALERIAAAVEHVRRWRTGEDALADAVARAFDVASPSTWTSGLDDRARLDIIDDASLWRERPLITRTDATAGSWQPFDAVIKRYLAARLFANWMAYQGRGLRSVVEWLRICLAVLRNEIGRHDSFIEAVRRTDLAVIHRIDPITVARSLEAIEQP